MVTRQIFAGEIRETSAETAKFPDRDLCQINPVPENFLFLSSFIEFRPQLACVGELLSGSPTNERNEFGGERRNKAKDNAKADRVLRKKAFVSTMCLVLSANLARKSVS